jgi:hypothetical protein
MIFIVAQNNMGRNVVEFAAKECCRVRGGVRGPRPEIIKWVIKIEVKNERGGC